MAIWADQLPLVAILRPTSRWEAPILVHLRPLVAQQHVSASLTTFSKIFITNDKLPNIFPFIANTASMGAWFFSAGIDPPQRAGRFASAKSGKNLYN